MLSPVNYRFIAVDMSHPYCGLGYHQFICIMGIYLCCYNWFHNIFYAVLDLF